ncbi:MAG: DUF5688 family protein [Clostridia bacterium]|nr:DUF5688 family protein [Clostridia bacterium]
MAVMMEALCDMMKYNEFKERAFNEIMAYMPEEYENYKIQINRIPKLNQTKETLYIYPEHGVAAIPSLYIDDMYNVYMRGASFEDTLRMTVREYVEGMEMGKEMGLANEEMISESNVILQLVNPNKNGEILDAAPHRKWLNLAIIYRFVLFFPGRGCYSTVINNAIAEEHGWSEEYLYQIAMKNTPRIFPQITGKFKESFHVLTNKQGMMGASVVLYDDVLSDIAESENDDLYLIPSSVHEMLAVPKYTVWGNTLNDMLREGNREIIESKDILSDTVYFYDRRKREVSIA